jgi:hypothetical protein
MALRDKKWKASVLGCVLSVVLLGGLTYAGTTATPQIAADQKSKVT